MRYRQILLLFLGLLFTLQATGQALMPDSICVGAQKHYWVYGDPGSTYTWTLKDPSGTTSVLPGTNDTIIIDWTFTPGSYALTTIQHSIYNCDGIPQTGLIELFEQAIAFAGNAKIFCTPDPYLLSDATASNYRSLLWTTSGDGTFDNNAILHPVYSPGPGDLLAGTVTLTLTARGWGSLATCPPAVSSVLIHQSATVVAASATANNVSCFGFHDGTATAVPSGGTGVYTYLWDDPAAQTTITATGLYPGTYSVIVTDENGCSDTASVVITQPPSIAANAGTDALICETSSYPLSSATAANYSSLTWSTSGNGTFNDPAILNPVYTPGTADIAAGNVTLKLTAHGIGSCPDSSDSMVLSISRQAVISAGSDTTICETAVYLTVVNSSAIYYTSLIWTTSGTGTFNNAALLHPVYTPSAADILGGSVILTLTGTSVAPCVNATDQMTLHITKQTFADAGPDALICETQSSYQITGSAAADYVSIQWFTSGTGTFNDPSLIAPIYTPGLADINSGSVTLTLTAFGIVPCADSSSSMVLSISRQAIVNAGPDTTICETAGSFVLSAATGIHYTGLAWTSSGTGTFNNPALLNPVYTPSIADILSGSVILTLTATSTSPCITVNDAMTLTIIRQAVGTAGPDVTICETQGSYSLASATAGFYASLLWTTSGTGTFNDPTLVNPVYTPDANDINAGSVILTMQLTGIAPCSNISDAMTLNISRQSASYAGPDDSICYSQPTYQLSQALATNYTSLLWTTSGTGSFNNPNVQNPVYTPSAADISSGLVQLTLTAYSAAPCVTTTDAMQLHIIPQLMASAGPDTAMCQNLPATITGSSASNFSSILWTHNGTGTLTNATSIHPTYVAGANESGLVTLTMTVHGILPCTDSIVDHLILNIYKLPTGTLSLVGKPKFCSGDSTTLRIDLTGTAPWALTYTDGISLFTLTNILSSPVILPVFPVATVTYSLVSLSDAHCNSIPSNLNGSVTVTVWQLPLVEFTWVNGNQNYEIIFNIDTTITNLNAIGSMIHWMFGDGTTGSNRTEDHIYPAPGTYQITLSVTDTNGCSNSVTHTITLDGAPHAFFAANDPVCLGQPVCFTNLSWVDNPATEHITTWIWNYGDGSANDTIHFPDDPDRCHTYAAAVTYTVTLTVIDNFGASNSFARNINILPNPVAGFTYTNACQDIAVQFTDQSSENGGGALLSWQWDFGDPSSGIHNFSTLTDPTHTFAAGGTYNVTLVITNIDNCSNTVVKQVHVNPAPPVAFAFTTACADQPVTFTADSLVMQFDSIASWSWNFGDGTPVQHTPVVISYTYHNPGTYLVTLTVTDVHGCMNTISDSVQVYPTPVADFYTNTPTCLGSPVQFTDHSSIPAGFTGYVAKWQWNFGDGIVQTIYHPSSPNVVHIYSGNTTDYNVTLTVWSNDSCSGSIQKLIHLNPAPVADFSYSTTTCAGQQILFTDHSQDNGGGIINQWKWNFGDPGSGINNFSTLQNPAHTYSASGTYSVQLIVINPGTCSDTITRYVTINSAPVADFTADTVCLGSVTHFTDQSIPNASGIVSWSWDFGDGTLPGIIPDPTHTYLNYGLYTVTLTIMNSNGCMKDTTQQVLVKPLPLPAFTFTSNNCTESAVLFTDMSSTVPGYNEFVTTWTWDFGDGSTPVTINSPASPNISHIFQGNATSHTVRLTVTSNSGCSSFVEHVVNSIPAPMAAFIYSSVSCENQDVQFTDQSQSPGGGSITQWNWNFGDPASGASNQSALQNPVHNFVTAGTYTVTLIVQNGGLCSDTITHAVIVNMKPVAGFIADTVCLGNLTHFTDQSVANASGIVSWSWNFGDGTAPGTGPNTSHTYANYGIYPVTLTIENTNGCIDLTTHQVLVKPLPVPAFIFSPQSCLGTAVFYTDQSATVPGYNESVTSWTWDFGDGSSPVTINAPASPDISHIFSGNATVHIVRLTVTSNSGCSSFVEHTVNSVPSPVAAFIYNSVTCEGQAVQFTDQSQTPGGTPVIQWNWNFGDPVSGAANQSTDQNPSHVFATPGAYTVTLIVHNANLCSDTISHIVNINMKPVADFGSDTACLGNLTHFTDQSVPNASGITSWSWNFGDGGTSTQTNPTHTYLIYGIYPVTLTIVNTNGCIDNTTLQVVVKPRPVPAFAYSSQSCIGTPVLYTDQSTIVPGYNESIISWTWNFGDGSSPVTINAPASPDISHIFVGNATVHIVRLTVTTNSGCSSFVEHTVTSSPSPVADFGYPALNCMDQSVQFTDMSQLNQGGPIITWNWNFGDPGSGAANTSNVQDPLHVFSSAGTFNVTLVVLNGGGCSDTIIKQVVIYNRPTANFTADSACLGSVTTFTDLSTTNGSDLISAHFWEFGDGGTSTQTNPTHIYANAGTYPVRLTVKTSHGCTKDTTIEVLVHTLPFAAFSVSTPSCVRDSVQFTDLSTTVSGYIIRWKWEFGDGQTTIINYPQSPNVRHAYAYAGSFDVKLTVTTSDSCSNSRIMTIIVQPKPTAGFIVAPVRCSLTPLQFTDASEGTGGIPVVGWSWNFDDPGSGAGNTSTLQNPSHSFTQAGTYNVLLIVTNANGCIDSIIKPVLINELPVAQFTADTACNLSPTHFTDVSTPGSGVLVGWQWNFGDPASGTNNTSTLRNPSHLFSSTGSYNVTLLVTNSNSCEQDTVIPVYVSPSPHAMFSYTATCTGDSTQFTDLSTAPNSQIISWLWDFGDGGSSTLQNPWHAFILPGTYDVKLTVTNLSGCRDSIVIQLIARPKPVAAYQYTSFFCPPGRVMFQDNSSAAGAGIKERLWIFEPGSSSSLINPVHTFGVQDTSYLVTLIVTDIYGCTDTINKSVYVKPGFAFTFSFDTLCHGEYTWFTSKNLTPGDSITRVEWDFGDPASGPANISHKFDPEHKFTKVGTFYVKLKAWDNENCVDSVLKPVIIHEVPVANFTSVSLPCKFNVDFTDQSVEGSGTISKWVWDFGDGTLPETILYPGPGNTSHDYTKAGDYTVILTVYNSYGCISTHSDVVHPGACLTAIISQKDSIACARSMVEFQDNSIPVPGITSWHWYWGDGTDTTYIVYSPVVQHLFANPGTYTVKLVIKVIADMTEFTDTATEKVIIRTTPMPIFSGEEVCMNTTTVFKDHTETYGVPVTSWNWNFGDPSSGTANTSGVKDPTHKYDAAGTYDVKLIVMNQLGCIDSLVQPAKVNTLPVAQFNNTNPCRGNPTRFRDNSITKDTSIMAWRWNFGVESTTRDTSDVQDPVYQYNTEGYYSVRLIVIDHNGCLDTVDSIIRVNVTPVSAFTLTENFNGMPGKIRLNNLSTGATTYEWEFGNGGSSVEENPVVTYTMDGTYLIMLISSNQFNCTDTSYYNYDVLFKGLFVPNAFSPESDNLSLRLFKPVGKNLKQYNIRIFDSWGHLLWESSSLNSEGSPLEGWDGMYNGKMMPQATYMWRINATFIDNSVWEGSDIGKGKFGTMGTVSLIR